MKAAVAALLIVSLSLTAARPAAAQAPQPPSRVALSTEPSCALRAQSEAERIGSLSALAVAVIALGGAIASGAASEIHGPCTSIFCGILGTTGPVIGHDDGLLTASIALAGTSLLLVIVGAVLMASSHRRLRDLQAEAESRSRVSRGATAHLTAAGLQLVF